MSQFTDDLRAIVGIKDVESRLKALENKAAIPGDRGTAYKNPDGTVSTSKAGGTANGGYSNASNVAGVNQDKNVPGDPNNPATSGGNPFISPENGSVDIEDLLDNQVGPQEPSPPGALFKDTLNRVTGMKDPVSGSSFIINEDGRFIPPNDDSWETADDSVDPYWELGYYWSAPSPGGGFGSSPGSAIDASVAAIRALYPDPMPFGYGEAYWEGGLAYNDPSSYIYTWYQGPGGGPLNATVGKLPCGTMGGTYCPYTAPTRLWPIAPYFQLALNALVGPSALGTLVTSALDSVAPLNFSSAPVSTVNFKFDSDTRFGSRVPIRGGGFAYGETDSGYTYTGNVHLFAADGTSLGVLPAAIYNADYAL